MLCGPKAVLDSPFVVHLAAIGIPDVSDAPSNHNMALLNDAGNHRGSEIPAQRLLRVPVVC